jgi:hypothetical protein
MNTCDQCANYKLPSGFHLTNEGSCKLMGDSNERDNDVDRCSGWDAEGYRAGVYVGPKFGCIHWMKKEQV